MEDGSCVVYGDLNDGKFNLLQSGVKGVSDGIFPGENFVFRARCGETTFTEVGKRFAGRVINQRGPAFGANDLFDRTGSLTVTAAYGKKLPMRIVNFAMPDKVDNEFEVTFSGWVVDAAGKSRPLFNRANAFYLRARGADPAPVLIERGDKLLIATPPS